MKNNPLEFARKPLCAAVLGTLVTVSYATVLSAETTVNADAAPQPFVSASSCNPCDPCNPCASECNPCNPCASACNPCNPCNPCASACNPCNPCASACNPCNPCNPCASACNPCNPCASACNPCASACNPCNPCASACNPCNPCASACNPCNPCAASAGKTITVAGTLVDTQCYSKNAAFAGQDHGSMKGCATACAKMGIPVALLSGSEMFIITAPAPVLAAHMSKEARLTGKEVQTGIISPTQLEIKTDSGWKVVSTSAMM